MRWGLAFKLFLLTFLPVLVSVVSFSYLYYHLIRTNGLRAVFVWWMVCLAILLWSFWMSRRYFLTPVLGLKEAAQSITQGNLNATISVANHDELGELALIFNKMTEDLRKTTVSKDFLNHLLQALPEAVLFLGEDRKIEIFNHRAEELFEYEASEILGKEIFALFPEAQRELFKNYLGEFVSEEASSFSKPDFELTAMRRSRQEFFAKITLSKTFLHQRLICGVIFRDMSWEKEALRREKSLLEEALATQGRERQRLDELSRAQRAYLNIIEDLDRRRREVEQREKELRETQTQLVQSGKLALVGQLASGVAHEINNPLQAIQANLEVASMVLKEQFPQEQKELSEILEDTKKATQRCKEIVQGMLRFAKPSITRFEAISLADPIAESLSLAQSQLRRDHIHVEKVIPKTLPKIKGDARELMQVFVNLILNATRAMSESKEKKLTITAEIQGKEIRVSFHDTGHGIAPEILPRIFDPFFTTSYEEASGKMKGTGLGLTICQRIIEEHHGRIEAKSESGQGSTFNIFLPC